MKYRAGDKPLLAIYRGNVLESLQRGSIIAVSSDGKIKNNFGEYKSYCFMRSGAKPFQAIPLIESGAFQKYGITFKELAVMCSSHRGEEKHINLLKRILKKTNMGINDIKCGIHAPYDPDANKKLVRENKNPTVLHSNCSGKHIAMLILCRHLGFPNKDYFKINHRVQKLSIGVLSDLAEIRWNKIKSALDGCGVPTFALPLFNTALLFAKLSNPSKTTPERKNALLKIQRAMAEYPEYTSGSRHFNTCLTRSTKGRIIAKSGVNSVGVSLLDQGLGIVFKMENEVSDCCKYSVIVEALRQMKAVTGRELLDLKKYHKPFLKNLKGEKTGFIKFLFKL